MASTFTGLKLQGLMGHFGKTAATDIESYVVLPDGKVYMLWQLKKDWGNSIKTVYSTNVYLMIYIVCVE